MFSVQRFSKSQSPSPGDTVTADSALRPTGTCLTRQETTTVPSAERYSELRPDLLTNSALEKVIETYWNQPDQTGDYDCPQCRKRFRTRPDLLTNSVLEKVIEKLHQAGFKVPALPKHCYAGPEDVACDLCTEKQLKAVKSCLTCTASYCESHVRHHYTVAALQRHTLVGLTGNLEQKLCQLHHRALEVFCKTDQVSVCLVCALQDHRNHDVIKNERDTEEENTKTQEEQMEARLHREIMILQHNTEELPAENSDQAECGRGSETVQTG
ncbi:E3 ubiquitin-protein ligase TRIM8-like [Oncorhynchus nerka]|uniref:E3 ubiquitin-protein ligase TRIM8-like n=1 Tax=Oncorhynchus nerka TaxID=8023 RepID=UPI0031B825D7